MSTSDGKKLEIHHKFFENLKIITKSRAGIEPVTFAGTEYDSNTGLNYMGARYYSSRVGRFVSEDQAFLAMGNDSQIKQITKLELKDYLADPQGLNSYSYVKNNPLIARDPNGKWIENIIGWKNTIALGNWASSNGAARYATDNPVKTVAAVSIGGGALFAGCAIALTAASDAYLGGLGTACFAFCGETIKETQQTFQTVGKIGETVSGLMKNTARIPSMTETASYRIPDGLSDTVLSEVKNVAYQSYTNQLKDFAMYAQSNNLDFELYLRQSTQLSGPLQRAVNDGRIILRTLNGL